MVVLQHRRIYFTPVTNLDIANVGALDASSRDRPDLIGDPNLSNPTQLLADETNAWCSAALSKNETRALVGLCVELIKVDNVEEGALLRLGDKLGSAAGVLPDLERVSIPA